VAAAQRGSHDVSVLEYDMCSSSSEYREINGSHHVSRMNAVCLEQCTTGMQLKAPRLTLPGPSENPPIRISTFPLGLIKVQNNQPNPVLIQQAVLQRKDQATLLMMLQSITAPDLWPHVTPYERARMTSGTMLWLMTLMLSALSHGGELQG
jgi:hypothetical protein